MVMHTRKLPRMNDGYFDKHQNHPYQKYNPKIERRNDYIPDSRYPPLVPPNGNMPMLGHPAHNSHIAHGHHHHIYQAPRNFYTQKGSESERDRDYKSSRNKYTDGVLSPKEKRSKECEREKNTHNRNNSEKKSRTSGINCSVNRGSKYDKRNAPESSLPSVSEWSEHISSSGKKYYYNCISEVSQWEKPRDWDSQRTSKDSAYSSRNNRVKRSWSRKGRHAVDTNKPANHTSDRYYYGCENDSNERSHSKHTDTKDGQSQDMDISPNRSTPLSESSYRTREPHRADATVPPVVVLDNSNQTTGSLLAAALPRIVTSNGGASPAGFSRGAATGRAGMSSVAGPSRLSGCSTMAASGSSDTSTLHRDAGPPTPTHSENTDPHAPPLHLNAARPRKMDSLGCYSSVVGNRLQHAPPILTPSLINYVRTDLIPHVVGWPADILEKQANKYMDEAYQLGSLHCTRVSAELKCSRSLVRLTEIQATLQDQKLMYLQQQITRLEELKSQNTFMSDD